MRPIQMKVQHPTTQPCEDEMKQGSTFETLERKINATAYLAEDFVLDGKRLEMTPDGKAFYHDLPDFAPHSNITDVAHQQIGSRLGIPRAYYQHMREEKPELLATNVNAWLSGSGKHMLRAVSNHQSDYIEQGDFTRALLSDRYRRIDNNQVLDMLMPKIAEKDHVISSCELTPYNMFVKVTFPFAQAEVAKGDVIEAGVMVRNSEVGYGSCSVALFIHRLVCTNGMWVPETIFNARKYHSGPKLAVDSDDRIISDQTRILEDQAHMSSLHDVIDAARNEKTIKKIAQDFRDASEDVIEGEVVEVVERLSKRLLITKDEQAQVRENLVRDGDFSRWGFANAVTRTAQDVGSYDRATELEKLGGQVIAMSSREFTKLAA